MNFSTKQYTLMWLFIAVTVIAIAFGIAVSAPDNYHFGQQVEITDGFYKHQVGTVIDRHWFGRYTVEVEGGSGYGSSDEEYKVREGQLKPVIPVEPEIVD